MNTINYRSIRTSLLFLVLLIFLPLFAIVIHSALVYKQSVKQAASENALRVARSLAEQQKIVESNTRQFLQVISQLPEIKSGDTSKINILFRSLLRENLSYASLLLVNTSGNIIATGLPLVKQNISHKKYFQDVMDTKSFAIGEYTQDRLSLKPVIHYAYPVIGPNGAILSILVASYDLNYYNQIFNKLNLGKDAIFKFVDHDGSTLFKSYGIAHHDSTEDSILPFCQLTSKPNESTFVVKGKDNIKRLFAIESLRLKNKPPYIYIYVGVPEENLSSGQQRIFAFNVIIWVMGMCLVIISAYIFSWKFIITPIDHLVKTTNLIAEGNLEIRTGISTPKSEIEMLAHAIDDMTEKLQRRDLEQKKTQKDLKRLKERFELAINSAHIGIWDWHIRNNTLIWDKNMFDLYGIHPENFNYRYESWENLVLPQDWIYLNAEIQNAIEYHRPFRSEFRINHPSLGIKHIRIFASVINDKGGKPVRLIGVNWDMTDGKILERKLSEAKNKAETNDKLKSTFLANISHEIRTPLHGIIGFAQILKGQEVTEEERLQYLDIIINSGNKLMNIISNIIDISMLDANQLTFVERECNLHNLLKEIFDSYEKIRIKENKAFAFILESEINDSMIFRIDEYRVKQIFSNLIDNAFKFTESGEVCIGCRIFNDELLCYVKDSGIGICSENLIKIFDRFKQIEENNNRSYSGSGLGLAISKGLLDVIGGRIWAVSKENGSDFYFSLPLRKPGKSHSPMSSSSSENSLFA
jgi:signal transduction histidine kinase